MGCLFRAQTKEICEIPFPKSILKAACMASSVERNISDELEALLECPICMEPLKEPRSLPCFHNFCKICLTNYVAGLRGENIEQFPCPTCRSQFTLKSNENVEGMPGNYFIRNMLEVMSIQQRAKASKCQCCEEDAVSRCVNCEMFMCDNCANCHSKFPSHKKHTVLSLSELNDPEGGAKIKSKLYCKKHENKTLKFYCQTCKELSCTHCMVLTHITQNHSCVSVEEIAQKQREVLQSSCETIDEKLSDGKKALDGIAGVMKLLEENVSTAKQKIREEKENILKKVAEKLDEREKEMVKEVDDSHEKLLTELRKQHDEIKQYVDKVQGSVSLPRNLLKKGSIEEILSFQKVIDENIEMLKNERPENLEAVNDGGIEHVPNVLDNINVDDLIKKLGSIYSSCYHGLGASNILKGEIAFIKQLHQWLRDKCGWNLCYQASRDGWTGQNFHRHCDDKGPTVVLIKVNNFIFGGFNDQSWTGDGYKRSTLSFLFSLRNNENLAPFIAKLKPGREEHAICCVPGYGPTFGGGHDLHICDNPHANYGSYCNLKNSYHPPPGTRNPKSLLAGSHNQFTVNEIEVYV